MGVASFHLMTTGRATRPLSRQRRAVKALEKARKYLNQFTCNDETQMRNRNPNHDTRSYKGKWRF